MSQSRHVSPEDVVPFKKTSLAHFRDTNPRLTYSSAMVYPISQFHNLLSAAQCIDSDDEDFQGNSSEPPVVLRFLLNSHGVLTLGHEGIPSRSIPAHKQLLQGGNCISAGNLFVHSNGTLCGISNKSGDFTPSFQSLQFALRQLQHAGIRFSNTLLIERSPNNSEKGKKYTVSSAALIAYLATMPVTMPIPPAIPLPVETSASSSSSSSAQKRTRNEASESSRENSRPTLPSTNGIFSSNAVTQPSSTAPQVARQLQEPVKKRLFGAGLQ